MEILNKNEMACMILSIKYRYVLYIAWSIVFVFQARGHAQVRLRAPLSTASHRVPSAAVCLARPASSLLSAPLHAPPFFSWPLLCSIVFEDVVGENQFVWSCEHRGIRMFGHV